MNKTLNVRNGPTFSVVMITCDGSRHLKEQLESIFRQTHAADEIIISDDASADGTVEFARQLSVATGITLNIHVNRKRLGVVRNLEQAVTLARGDLIVLADQDDIWLPDRLEQLAQVCTAFPTVDVMWGDAQLIDDHSAAMGRTLWDAMGITHEERRAIAHGSVFSVLLRRNIVTGATVAFRRSMLPDLLPFDDNGPHDYWIGLIAAALDNLHTMPRPLIQYRVHQGNTVGIAPNSLVTDVVKRKRRSGVRESELRFFTAVGERLRLLGASAERIDAMSRKLEHVEARLRLGRHRPERLVPVARALGAGRYTRYGRGLRSALYDLWFGGA